MTNIDERAAFEAWTLRSAIRAALAATPAAAAQVVLPEPVTTITSIDELGPCFGWLEHWANFPIGTKLYTEQQMRAALLAGVSAPAAQAVKPEPHASGQVGDTVIFHFDDAAQAREFYSATQSLQLAVAAPQAAQQGGAA